MSMNDSLLLNIMGKIISSFYDFETYIDSLHSLKKVEENGYKVLNKIKKNLAMSNIKDVSITYSQGKFLSFLIQSYPIFRILELGVYFGYSSLAMALALKGNKRDGKIIACDQNKKHLENALMYWKEAKVDHLINSKLGFCSDVLEEYIEKKVFFDMIFIDADKKNYLSYYEKSLLLIQSGGFIIFDNVLWKGTVLKSGKSNDFITCKMKEFNQKIFNDIRIYKTCIPFGDGFLWVVKK